MISLSQVVIEEKNKLSSGSAELILMEIELPQLPDSLKIVLNTDPIEWSGQLWTPFPFELDDITEDSKGEVPNLSLKISNIDRTMQGYMDEGKGGVGGTVTIRVVNSAHLDIVDPLFEEEFSIVKSTANEMWATFTLGASYPMTARRPLFRHLRNHCPHEYGGIVCAASSASLNKYPECDKSLVDCRLRKNSERFGGEPAIQGGFYV